MTPDALVDVLARGGIEGVRAEAEDGAQPMRGADDWWSMILGTGYRGTFDALAPDERERVERHVRDAVADSPSMRTPVVLATATKPVAP